MFWEENTLALIFVCAHRGQANVLECIFHSGQWLSPVPFSLWGDRRGGGNRVFIQQATPDRSHKQEGPRNAKGHEGAPCRSRITFPLLVNQELYEKEYWVFLSALTFSNLYTMSRWRWKVRVQFKLILPLFFSHLFILFAFLKFNASKNSPIGGSSWVWSLWSNLRNLVQSCDKQQSLTGSSKTCVFLFKKCFDKISSEMLTAPFQKHLKILYSIKESVCCFTISM